MTDRPPLKNLEERWRVQPSRHGAAVRVEMDTERGTAVLIHLIPWRDEHRWCKTILNMRTVLLLRLERGYVHT